MTILLTAFLISTLVQLSYWFFFIGQFKRIQRKKSSENPMKAAISMIICLKNESENLQTNHQYWSGQLEDGDELILVDDFSSDQTFSSAEHLSSRNKQIHVISASFDRPGKKQALIDGVNKASNEYVLVTDADCKPPLQWKEKMAAKVLPSTDFVLGYGPFAKHDGFLNLFQRFECVMTAMQYFAYAKAGAPYMGVGRNLLFRKNIFDPALYKSELASGDDDLLVSAKANGQNTAISIDPETFVYSEATKTWYTYWKQKLRHISSSVEYKSHIKILLSLFSLSQMLTYTTGIILLFSTYWQMVILLFLCKIFVVGSSLYVNGKILKEQDLFWYTAILDLCLALYYLILAFSFPFIKKTKWS